MNASPRLEPAALDAVLAALLDNNPSAPIVAIDPHGLFVPMPASVPITGQRVIQGHSSALELVEVDDTMIVIESWTQAVMSGVGCATVRLVSEPERTVAINFVDAMHRHGVYIGLFEVESSDNLFGTCDGGTLTLRPRVALIEEDARAFIQQVDEATSQMLGWSADELVGRRALEVIDPHDYARAIAHWMDVLRSPGTRRRVRLRHRHRNGSLVWVEVTSHNLLNDPAHRHVVTEMVDISDEMAAQDALRQRELLLRRLTETLPQGIFQIDADGDIVYRNARLALIVGNRQALTIQQQLAAVLPRHRNEIKQALDAVLLDGRDCDLEVGLRLRSAMRRCTLSLRALKDESGVISGALVSVADVTDGVRMREVLQYRATFDVLTRCLNRASVLELLERTLAGQPGGIGGTGAIFVDLDHFKAINDRLGHAAGDVLLVEAARRLRQAVRPSDIVGRLGGDEFLVVCPVLENAAAALQIAKRIGCALVVRGVQLKGAWVTPRASIGVAFSSDVSSNADALVARADGAMYESKRVGLGRPVLSRNSTAAAGSLPRAA